MNREEKIEFLRGLSTGTRSLVELVPEPKEEVNYSLMTTCELKTFLDILYPNHFGHNNHGPHVYTKVFSVDEIMDIGSNDVPKRSHLEKAKRGVCTGITFETIFYKESTIPPVTHIEYSWKNRSLAVFPTKEELAMYQQLDNEELSALFENKLNQLLNP